MELAALFDYSANCNRAMHELLSEHPSSFTQRFETLSAFKSVGDLLSHCIGAEERWVVGRLIGETVDRYEARAATTVDGWYRDFQTTRARTRAYFDALSATGLARIVEFDLPNWNHAGSLSVEHMLFHVLNHESFHRGQASMALQQQGIDPPNFDYPFFGA